MSDKQRDVEPIGSSASNFINELLQNGNAITAPAHLLREAKEKPVISTSTKYKAYGLTSIGPDLDTQVTLQIGLYRATIEPAMSIIFDTGKLGEAPSQNFLILRAISSATDGCFIIEEK